MYKRKTTIVYRRLDLSHCWGVRFTTMTNIVVPDVPHLSKQKLLFNLQSNKPFHGKSQTVINPLQLLHELHSTPSQGMQGSFEFVDIVGALFNASMPTNRALTNFFLFWFFFSVCIILPSCRPLFSFPHFCLSRILGQTMSR